MTHLMWQRAAWFVLLGACTPLGLWLYEAPVVTVYRVTLELRESRTVGGSPVTVALAVENRNDYPLSTERVELSLRMNGVPIGRVAHDTPVAVAMETISTVAMPLELEKHATKQQLEVLRSGTHLFAVRGRAMFRTPFGKREVRFAQEGEMVFGQRSSQEEQLQTRKHGKKRKHESTHHLPFFVFSFFFCVSVFPCFCVVRPYATEN